MKVMVRLLKRQVKARDRIIKILEKKCLALDKRYKDACIRARAAEKKLEER